jgi:hypothetical protein
MYKYSKVTTTHDFTFLWDVLHVMRSCDNWLHVLRHLVNNGLSWLHAMILIIVRMCRMVTIALYVTIMKLKLMYRSCTLLNVTQEMAKNKFKCTLFIYRVHFLNHSTILSKCNRIHCRNF